MAYNLTLLGFYNSDVEFIIWQYFLFEFKYIFIFKARFQSLEISRMYLIIVYTLTTHT